MIIRSIFGHLLKLIFFERSESTRGGISHPIRFQKKCFDYLLKELEPTVTETNQLLVRKVDFSFIEQNKNNNR